MKHVIHEQPDLYFECIPFLQRLYNGESITQVRDRIVERIGLQIDETEIALLFNDVIDLYKEIQRRIELSGPLAELLFKKRDPYEPLAYTLWRYRFYDGTVSDVRKKVIYDIFSSDSGTSETEGFASLSSEDDFFGWLDALDIPLEDKYALVFLYHQMERCCVWMQTLVDATSAILQEHIHLFQPSIDALVAELREEIAMKGINFISGWANVRLDEKDEFHIYPTLSFSALVFSSDLATQNIMLVGIRIRELLRLENEHLHRGTKQIEFIKALADSTKFNILLRLKQDCLYSGQLADILRLTGATISHHMSTLVQLRLVSIDKRGNRVYYELNTAVLAAYLDELHRLLVE